MSTEIIWTTVDAETAHSCAAASPQHPRKVEVLLRLGLRELTQGPVRPLGEIMDEIGAEAESRALTPEMLESMLR
jgi:hypothetical protein